MATVNGVVAATNANDAARVGSYFTSDAVVVDESRPFVWRGDGAGTAWWHHVQGMLRTAALHATTTAPTEVQIDRANGVAYVVVPMHITVTAKRTAHTESGLWALTLRRSGSAWNITTASWATLRP
jgi:ketosteroid isomerase-like protein